MSVPGAARREINYSKRAFEKLFFQDDDLDRQIEPDDCIRA
jgi:hypothetical protein